ncbi:MAG: tyrosinase family protein [Bacteroidota bacterium]|nr:tyrosinase family protein [Bacteroidota bacterium]
MRKSFLLSAGVAIALFSVIRFGGTNSETAKLVPTAIDVIECAPSSPYVTRAVKFTPPAPGFAVMVRKNVYSLTPAEITSLKTGITNMKALPLTDPTSWTYQAAIHGTALPNALPSWNSCHQSGAAFFFLAWHRMYCYFFERILRAKSGNPNLTLPYWNYQTNPVLHPDYRNSTAGNPLYDGTRNSSINTGGSLPASIGTSINNALLEIPYFDFQGGINGPHGSVHVTVGGNMVSVSSAGQDPLFWLHHCNVDRLWDEWLGKCGGRAAPTDAAWLNKTYTFFDETGTAISMTGSQVITSASQLNYKYDDSKSCFKPLPWKWYVYKRWPLIKWPIPYLINTKMLKRSLKEAKPETLDNFIKERNKSRFNFDDKEAPDKLIIELESVKVDKSPEGVVEVYLNLPGNEQPNAKSKSFVGLLDLFSVQHANAHPNMKGMASETRIELNASKAARALGLSMADLKNAEISFYVRGNTLRGKELNAAAVIKVGGINMAIELAQR